MLLRAVVWNKVGDDPNTAVVGFFDEFFQIFKPAEIGLDFHKIGDVIPMVGAGFEERRQPERVNPQLFQVIKLLGNAFNISTQKFGIIPVTAFEAREPVDQNVINDRLLKPMGICHFGFFSKYSGSAGSDCRSSGFAVGMYILLNEARPIYAIPLSEFFGSDLNYTIQYSFT